MATLPRHIGQTLAHASGLGAADCPIEVPSFVVRQTWHMRHEDDPGHRWLRSGVADLVPRLSTERLVGG